ncbi:MAG: hypothetical protein U0835_14420 [Isosphaeraceae bacterium]
MMILVALAAFALGIWSWAERRRERLIRSGLAYNRVAAGLELGLVENSPRRATLDSGSVDETLARIHWNDSVANEFYAAARYPWWPSDPDPLRVVCRCGGCVIPTALVYPPTSADLLFPASGRLQKLP